MKKNKSILWIIHQGQLSGANYALSEHIEVLIDMGFLIEVISPTRGSFVDYLNKKEIKVTIVPFYNWTRKLNQGFFIKNWFKRFLRNILAIKNIVSLSKKADIICTNTLAPIVGVISAKIISKPHYLFVHEFGQEDHGFKLAFSNKYSYNFLAKNSKKIILNSSAVKSKWKTILDSKYAKKIDLLYNIVHFDTNSIKYKLNKKTPYKFLILGQISVAKGHLEAIKAIVEIHNKGIPVVLDIIGSNANKEYFEEINNLVITENASLYINILPPVDNPYLVFYKYNALLMCSRMEAFGRVTVEAMQCGLPVIGANTGGTKDIVKDGFNGFLYKKGNIDDLIKKILKLISLPNEAKIVLSDNALLIRKEYNEKTAKNQFNKILNI